MKRISKAKVKRSAIRRNERDTEALFREELLKNEYASTNRLSGDGALVEEQKSTVKQVTDLLRQASKSGKGGAGHPEFMITNSSAPDVIVVVECKADVSDHESDFLVDWVSTSKAPQKDEAYFGRAVKYAADGVLHYAHALSKRFTVIAIAASAQGVGLPLRLSTYLWPRGASTPRALLNCKSGAPLDSVVPWAEFVRHARHDPLVTQGREKELMDFARDLHDQMRVYKLTEMEKPLLVSGTLLALRDSVFRAAIVSSDGPVKMSAERIQGAWFNSIKETLGEAGIHQDKRNTMLTPYKSLSEHTELRKESESHPNGVMLDVIRSIDRHVFPFMNASNGMDVLGRFYGEFLRYTAGDKKGLGIVLTPRHITDLFSDIANVQHDSSVVMDLCAGTGGFLISSMAKMVNQCKSAAEEHRVKAHGLVGVEQQSHMFALAASNMILRGDGKANLFQGSCFDKEIVEKVKACNPNVGMINPPYSQADKSELAFIEHMLDLLSPHGVGIAIVPMSSAIKADKRDLIERASIMSKHTLEGAMSMPSDLFHPVGTVVTILVFTAHVPHAKSGKDTWFGYWREDGFVKSKSHGRFDGKGVWDSTRDRWVDSFRNRKSIPGESVSKKVGPEDEWCAEAYMETDYGSLSRRDFEDVLKGYVLFQVEKGMRV